jgi:hypothetical protein
MREKKIRYNDSLRKIPVFSVAITQYVEVFSFKKRIHSFGDSRVEF